MTFCAGFATATLFLDFLYLFCFYYGSIYMHGYWKILQVALFSRRWPRIRKLLVQNYWSRRLEMTCNKTDSARKFRRWRYYRPTWPELEGQVDSGRLTRPDSQVYRRALWKVNAAVWYRSASIVFRCKGRRRPLCWWAMWFCSQVLLAWRNKSHALYPRYWRLVYQLNA